MTANGSRIPLALAYVRSSALPTTASVIATVVVSTVTTSSSPTINSQQSGYVPALKPLLAQFLISAMAREARTKPVARSFVIPYLPPKMWRCSGGTTLEERYSQSSKLTTTWRCKEWPGVMSNTVAHPMFPRDEWSEMRNIPT